ncbi:MAG: OstA-like protein, partial [Bacteroidia bacterium]
ASKTVAFKYNVKLTNPKLKMIGDTLQYNTVSKTAYFTGPTNVISAENRLYCEYGWYNTQTEKSQLNTNAVVYSKESELHADSIYYDRKAGYGKAYSCVQIKDTLNKTELLGNLAEHYEKVGISIVTGNAVLIKIMKEDSLLLSADTLFSQEIKRDSTQLDSIIVKAYKHVKLYKSDLSGIADSLVYTNTDSTLILFNSPVLWSDSAQLNAREIKIRLSGKGMKSFELQGNAFVITQEDSIKFNQIKGKEILGTFVKDSIDRIEVKGNAQVAYFIKNEKKKYVAFSKTNSARVSVYFVKGQMDRITFIDKPTSQLIPMKTVDPVKERLKGFTWNPFKKPKSKYELLKF